MFQSGLYRSCKFRIVEHYASVGFNEDHIHVLATQLVEQLLPAGRCIGVIVDGGTEVPDVVETVEDRGDMLHELIVEVGVDAGKAAQLQQYP